MAKDELSELIREEYPGLPLETVERVLCFYGLLVEGNQRQNLTKLVSPREFFHGHFEDVMELLDSGLVSFPAMDLGSGCGVPGLLAAVVSGGEWVLAESEGRKADFLSETVDRLDLSRQVGVFRGRGEDWLGSHTVNTVVARAVGPVERIFSWLEKCSTWNKMVLLKGPGWAEEWETFSAGVHRKKLGLGRTRQYTTGPEGKHRVIVELRRADK